MPESDRQRSYFHPALGWSDEPEGASLRLDAQVRWLRRGAAETILYRRSAGRWEVILDEEELDGRERGLAWRAWKTQVAGKAFLVFHGVRPIDSTIAFLLEGLNPYDLDGQALASAADAGFLFALNDADAREFSRRVLKEQGGSIELAKAPGSGEAERILARLRQVAASIEMVRAEDADTLARARDGDFSQLPSFDQRTATFLTQFSQIGEQSAALERSLAHLRSQERSSEERAYGEQLLREGRRIQLAMQAERAGRDEEASELSYRQAVATGALPPREPSLRRSAAVEIGLAARRNGFSVAETAEGVRITVGSKEIVLGPGFTIEDAV